MNWEKFKTKMGKSHEKGWSHFNELEKTYFPLGEKE